jgi:hypothetical protein
MPQKQYYWRSQMGAWGHDSFDNDDAGDWVYELEESSDMSVIVEFAKLVTLKSLHRNERWRRRAT